MENSYNNFDNMESNIKSSIIHERVNLVTTHMYKQYLDYEKSVMNMTEIVSKMRDNIEIIINYLKQSFASRGVSTQNIKFDVDQSGTVIVVNILWHQFSIVSRYNDVPMALKREKEPMFSSRIIAIAGNYFDIVKKIKDNESELDAILKYETASLYVPAEKSKPAIMKIDLLSNKEFPQSQIDAPRDFILKVIELTCGGGLFHQEGKKKSITLDI